MMRIILASHGRLAQGMKDSVGLIMGNTDMIHTICAYCDPNVSVESQIEQVMKDIAADDITIVLTDIFGGSVNNEFMKCVSENNIHLIAGMSMPLVIQLLEQSNEEWPKDKNERNLILEKILQESKENVIYCNSLFQRMNSVEEDF